MLDGGPYSATVLLLFHLLFFSSEDGKEEETEIAFLKNDEESTSSLGPSKTKSGSLWKAFEERRKKTQNGVNYTQLPIY